MGSKEDVAVGEVLESKEGDSLVVPLDVFQKFQKSHEAIHEKLDNLDGKMSNKQAFLISLSASAVMLVLGIVIGYLLS